MSVGDLVLFVFAAKSKLINPSKHLGVIISISHNVTKGKTHGYNIMLSDGTIIVGYDDELKLLSACKT